MSFVVGVKQIAFPRSFETLLGAKVNEQALLHALFKSGRVEKLNIWVTQY